MQLGGRAAVFVRAGRGCAPALCAALLGVAVALAPAQAQAQTQAQAQAPTQQAQARAETPSETGFPRLPIVVFDHERVLANSIFGLDLERRVATARDALIAENTEVQNSLQDEELALTELRETLDGEAFRVQADAFDAKVVRIRAEQDAKSQAIQKLYEDGVSAFDAELRPILAQIARESGALVMFERAQVYLVSDYVDVSDRAVVLLNERAAAQGLSAPQDSETQDQTAN